jgi:hypothetical protein
VNGETLAPQFAAGTYPDVEKSLASAARLLKRLGASLIEARNLADWEGVPSLLVRDPSLPLAAVIKGAVLTEEDGQMMEPGDGTGLHAMRSAISE